MEDALDIRRALDTSSGTTGNVLVPLVISEGVRMYIETRSPLWNIINKQPFDGYAYVYREQTGLPVASFGAELGALPAAQNAAYVERSVAIKSVYIRGELSGQIIEASRSLLNVLQREITNSSLGLVRTLEQKIVAGDATANPNEFDGLDKWITNTVDFAASGAPGVPVSLTLSMVDQLIDTPQGGNPTHLIMSKPMGRRIWSLLQAQQRFNDVANINGGFQVPVYGGLPIIRLFDNTTILQNEILAPNMDMVTIPVLKDVTYEELAHTRDSTDYFLKMYLTLVVEGGARYHAKAIDVKSS